MQAQAPVRSWRALPAPGNKCSQPAPMQSPAAFCHEHISHLLDTYEQVLLIYASSVRGSCQCSWSPYACQGAGEGG